MRLLNTTTFELEKFFGSSIPPYSILSHVQGSSEVTFQDLLNGRGPTKEGWGKILGCCAQARKDGWKYIWINTCCTDKSSSAELSEVINSTFRWYQRAQICYVYLPDVPENETDIFANHSAFRGSKWFTEAWTLQELLAPNNVVFFNRGWVEIGTKKSLETLISAITKIEHLFGWETASVAQKMSWASRRETLREEDMAYCLLGLFNVNMQPMYGEGEKAFLRLQTEIMKISDDESIFAWVDETLANGTSGLLARSPAAFKDSWNIDFCPNFRSAPYSMTNKGLQINLALSMPKRTRTERMHACRTGGPEDADAKIFTAFLYCARRGHDELLGLRLVKQWRNPEEYSRTSCNKLFGMVDSLTGQSAEKTVFIRQDSNYYANLERSLA
ncbi:hypothetical protein L207DRAFT_492374 [Hyaloscypha variabilis F]|uniref:Uncharacterized protein n=1 Tax=Hyaloscypha variabilis (strain UAMH 11265 / GT02V1 / F) TaxID=1149755 RepID=A0A2J6RJ21_HYAVF|nr:hypothetical protein L207DRAFT_492374 [Hyaloscypha variabilis F]